MTECGMSLDELRDKRGLAFILSKITLAIRKPLYAFEDIEVQTWTSPSRGYSFIRNFRILRGEDIIAEAYTVWALVDINNKSFCRVEESGYSFIDEEPLELEFPARFRLPKGLTLSPLGKRKIVYSDLDYNMHMNNTKYPDMLCDYMPIEDTGRICGMTLSYLNEAAFGDTLELSGAELDGTYYFKTVDTEGKTCLEAQVFLED
jgi:acyl-ACP thioesterase